MRLERARDVAFAVQLFHLVGNMLLAVVYHWHALDPRRGWWLWCTGATINVLGMYAAGWRARDTRRADDRTGEL